mmetsp:Transcript_98084/g.204600  ORF Transcript_98084/g.204600 Transcript_98084/m.204600 type:complete len:590 (-) Transcript_98084:170-1939(-)|eukprot:CAMPEP_0206476612 /NCGR_PEP_ID=MMETSP0324_2-20121206/34835_1 /ASSEMBLY_ACC=CAM_ASM_000836 /TAXON_ID=2866 /ORGANISM="Crypthecodinium cohnii, Strain Seligo" /LENGTH=589 /DNA_ID=CAMNT_0053952307 /DNA_START=116 /DNA_END=1885 /DNA_ORIENTATION=-
MSVAKPEDQRRLLEGGSATSAQQKTPEEKDSDYACYCCWPYSIEREISNWGKVKAQEDHTDFHADKVPKTFLGSRKAMIKENMGPVFVTCLRWMIPGFVNAIATFACMVMLHYGTYYYVHQMQLITTVFKRNHFGNDTSFSEEWQKSNEDVPLSIGWDWHKPKGVSDLVDEKTGTPKGKLSYGSLNDPVALALGFEQVDIAMLDKIAAFFPMGFVVSAYFMDELSVWTKIMICNSFLAIGKGLFGFMTTVPDSKGWGECQNRLGETGMEWMKHTRNFTEFLSMEFFGIPNENGTYVHLRWCADMMYSGHTYFTTLYALGAYELTYLFTKEFKKGPRSLCLGAVALIALAEQCVEIFFVLRNRFHYSMDVAMAVLLTFLFYTNGAIAQAAKNWQYIKFWKGKKPERDLNQDRSFAWAVKNSADRVGEEVHNEVVKRLKRLSPTKPGESDEKYKERIDRAARELGVSIVRTKDLKTNADVFIPPCCSCIFTGCIGREAVLTTGMRHHMFETEDMGDFLFATDPDMQTEMCQHMRLSQLHDIDKNKYSAALKMPDPEAGHGFIDSLGNMIAGGHHPNVVAPSSAPKQQDGCC